MVAVFAVFWDEFERRPHNACRVDSFGAFRAGKWCKKFRMFIRMGSNRISGKDIAWVVLPAGMYRFF